MQAAGSRPFLGPCQMPQLCQKYLLDLKCWDLPHFSPGRLCQDFSSALHLPEHHGLSFVSACKEGLLLLFYLAECSQISWKKHQINTIMIAIFIIRYDSASITMRSTSNWIGAHCTFRVQTPGIWCSWELNRFLTILYIAEKSFSSPSVFLFYLTDLWTSISPNFLFLGAMK